MPDTHYAALLHADAQAHARRRQPLRLILIFLAVFFALQYAWEMSRDTWLERTVIDHATVVPAAWLINALGTAPPVHADAYRIVSPLARLNIRNGCEGLETPVFAGGGFFQPALSLESTFVGNRPGHAAGVWPESSPHRDPVVRLAGSAQPVRGVARYCAAAGHDRCLPGLLPGVPDAP